MSDFISGIGFGDDLEQIDINSSGCPIIKSGYFYINNREYHLFADGVIVELNSSGVINDLPYTPGTPYFILNDYNDIKQLDSGQYYVDTADTEILEMPSSGVWNYQDENSYDFIYNVLSKKYLIFDAEESFTFVHKFVEDTYLILSNPDTDEPFNLNQYPLWLSASNLNKPLTFAVIVKDSNGALLDNEQITWYEVYDEVIMASGIYPSGIMTKDNINILGTSQTNEHGFTTFDITAYPNQENVFIYAESGERRSRLSWIQITKPIVSTAGTFQFDNDNVLWSSREAMTAIGMDAWGNLWASGVTPEYNGIITGDVEYPTRGDWKIAFSEYQRPPMMWASGVNEAEGYYNGEDFNDDYDISASGIVPFMNQQRCAVQGYWGQVIVSGYDLKNIAGYDTYCVNKTVNKYTIYYRDEINEDGIINTWAHDDKFGYKGSFEDVIGDTTDILVSNTVKIYYVLYCPGYTGDDPNWFKAHDFYFRGLALINVNENDEDDFLKQNYKIGQLITMTSLQKY